MTLVLDSDSTTVPESSWLSGSVVAFRAPNVEPTTPWFDFVPKNLPVVAAGS